AHAGEDPGLRDAGSLERIRDRAHHGVLADQVVEGRRPVLARQHAVRRVARTPGCATEIEATLGMIGIIDVVHRVIRLDFLTFDAFFGEPAPTPDQVRGKLSPENAMAFSLAGRRNFEWGKYNEWEADERPEPRSLGLLPSGPD